MRQTTPGSRPPQLSLDEQRSAVYASLLRFAPEATELRQRALDKYVLSGLIGSSEKEPLRAGAVQQTLRRNGGVFALRVETVKETLERLVKQGMAQRTKLRRRHAYYLTEAGHALLEKAKEHTDDLFDPVLATLLRNTEHLISPAEGQAILRAFIFECFARFGRRFAKSVLGRSSLIAHPSDINAAFDAAVRGRDLSSEALESLKNRCERFLSSSDVHAERLKLQLTQGYYLIELLGMQGAPFDPLADQAFRDSVFYLDTNILVMGLLSTHERAEVFEEFLRLASRIGIELRVTRATINETRRVGVDRAEDLRRFMERVPDNLMDLAHDDFLDAFLAARAEQPDLAPEDFLAPFFDVSTKLQQEWAIKVDDRVEHELLGVGSLKEPFARIAAVIQSEAEKTRGYRKSEAVLRHDLFNVAVVEQQRADNPKTWFLTSDRSLAQATGCLAEQQETPCLPACFFLASFLQSVSPFTTSPREEHSIADIFSQLLKEEVLPSHGLFDIRELLLISEMHEDVLATPKEELVPALDYVKKTVLQGRQYQLDEMPRVTLELKAFLAKSVEERQRALERENERLAMEAKAAEEARVEAERQRIAEEKAARDLREKLAAERKAAATLKDDLEKERGLRGAADQKRTQREQELQAELDRTRKQGLAAKWRDRAILGVIVGMVCWFFIDTLTDPLVQLIDLEVDQLDDYVRLGLSAIALIPFCLPALIYLRYVEWAFELKVVIFTGLVALGLALSKIMDDAAWSSIASYLEVAAFLAVLILGWIVLRRTR